jgi:hypothetical protein
MSITHMIISGALLFVFTAFADESKLTLQQFDSDVAKTRVEIREFCMIAQKLTNDNKMSVREKEKAVKLADKHISLAIKNWVAVKEKYHSSIPEQYRNDSQFTQ